MSRRPRKRIGKFDVIARIARGGMAEIFLARQPGLGGFSRRVVLKTILPGLAQEAKFVRMFMEEARLASQIHHPNVVQIFDVGEESGIYYIAMEYIDGLSVGVMTRYDDEERAPLPIAVASEIICQACAGLQAAHKLEDEEGTPLGLVHRDVSPHNLMVSREGVVKVVDFGVAKAHDSSVKTKAGTVKGKFAYMSPEQCLSKPLDRRSDIFSLGAVFYELLTGTILFRRDNELATMRAIVKEPIPRLSDVDPSVPLELVEVVARALARNREKRFGSASEMASAIRKATGEQGLFTTTETVADFLHEQCAEQLASRKVEKLGLLTPSFDIDSASALEIIDEPPARPVELEMDDEAPSESAEPASESRADSVPCVEADTLEAPAVSTGESRRRSTPDVNAPTKAGYELHSAGLDGELRDFAQLESPEHRQEPEKERVELGGGRALTVDGPGLGDDDEPAAHAKGEAEEARAAPSPSPLPTPRPAFEGASPTPRPRPAAPASDRPSLPPPRRAQEREASSRGDGGPNWKIVIVGLVSTLVVVVAAIVIATSGGEQAPEGPPLRYSFTPRFPQDAIKAGFRPLRIHLEKSLERPVELVEVSGASEQIDRLLAGEIDVATLSPLSFVRAREREPELTVIAMHSVEGGGLDQAYIIAREDEQVRSLEQLSGRRFCIPEEDSTTGSLLARGHFRASGHEAEQFFSKVIASRSQLRVISDVASGRCDAGGVSSAVWFNARELGVDAAAVRLVAEAGEVPRDVVCASPALSDEEIGPVKRAFTSFQSTAEPGAELLAIDRFSAFHPEAFTKIEALARTEGLIGTEGE